MERAEKVNDVLLLMIEWNGCQLEMQGGSFYGGGSGQFSGE
jgi:hypothetical protein